MQNSPKGNRCDHLLRNCLHRNKEVLNSNKSKLFFRMDGWTSVAQESFYGITDNFYCKLKKRPREIFYLFLFKQNDIYSNQKYIFSHLKRIHGSTPGNSWNVRGIVSKSISNFQNLFLHSNMINGISIDFDNHDSKVNKKMKRK